MNENSTRRALAERIERPFSGRSGGKDPSTGRRAAFFAAALQLPVSCVKLKATFLPKEGEPAARVRTAGLRRETGGTHLKRILVVFTGGTIGSAFREGVLDVDAGRADELLARYGREAGGRDVEFDVLRPMAMLSENAAPGRWRQLLLALDGADLKSYDGVIVTHGSDTLSYTAALLGYAYGGAGVPLVLTASGAPLADPRSNGVRNFAAAAALIQNEGIPGVFAVYENSRGVMEVFLATRLIEADLYSNDFAGFGGGPLGYMENGRLVLMERKGNVTRKELAAPAGAAPVPRDFPNEVLGITPHPGLDYTLFDLGRRPVKAVLHRLYHSSTACAEGGRYALPEFIGKCRERGVEVCLQSVKAGEPYATTRALLEAGAVPLPLMSFEAAYVKLWLAVNQTEMPARDFMLRPLYFEFV